MSYGLPCIARLFFYILCFTFTMDVTVPDDFDLHDILDSLDLAKQSDGESEEGAISLAADSEPIAPQSIQLCSSPSSAASTPPLEVEGVSSDREEAPLEIVGDETADESPCSDALGFATRCETRWLFAFLALGACRFSIQINI